MEDHDIRAALDRHWAASDAASLMTGSIVLADGGYTCW